MMQLRHLAYAHLSCCKQVAQAAYTELQFTQQGNTSKLRVYLLVIVLYPQTFPSQCNGQVIHGESLLAFPCCQQGLQKGF